MELCTSFKAINDSSNKKKIIENAKLLTLTEKQSINDNTI